MKLRATIPSPGDTGYRAETLPLLPELRAELGGSLEHFVRTWDPETGAEVVRITLDTDGQDAPPPGEQRRILGARGIFLGEPENDTADSSPLWNAGLSGTGFPRISGDLYRSATPIMADLARSSSDGRSAPELLDDALRMMVGHSRATLDHSPQAAVPGYTSRDLLTLRLLSYRSHYESVFARAKRPEEFEAACERLYQDRGHVARQAILSAWSTTTPFPDDTPFERWAHLVRTAHVPLMRAFESGEVIDVGKTLEDLEKERGERLERTRFHATPSPAVRALMYGNSDFLAFRMESSLLYSALYTLGYSLTERYVLCYVVSRANEDLSGRGADELRDELETLAGRIVDPLSPSSNDAPGLHAAESRR